jgi:hypothetical protein
MEITSTDLINYKATLTDSTSWYLGSLAGLLKKWHSLGYSGVTADAVALLKQLRTKGNQKGEAVLTHDPIHGPFTDIELESLQSSLDMAYAAWRGGQRRVFACLPVHVARAACRAVRRAESARRWRGVCERRDPRIHVADPACKAAQPAFAFRVQGPSAHSPGRRAAGAARNEVRAAFQGLLPDPSDAPLFPARRRLGGRTSGFEHHRTAQTIADLLERSLGRLNAMSERTGQRLHITATRFRRTVATRAAMEGHGELIIAELLDHTDTQNVGVYIEARPEIVERIDRAIAMYMAPMAQAFAGVIIDDESQASRAGDPSSRVCDPRFDPSMRPMGSCGKHGFCGFLAPIACYTCVSFQPWLDGPHEAVLEYLIGERDRLATGTDLRIASVTTEPSSPSPKWSGCVRYVTRRRSMAEIVLFTPKAELDAGANLRGFIEMARDRLTVFGEGLPFQHDTWDVTDAVATKGKGGKRERITFSTAATVGDKAPEMMREPFLSFAKAYVRYMHGMRPTKSIHRRVAALRSCEAALAENGTTPDPVQIDSRVLNRAAQIVTDRFGDGAAYRVGQQLEILATFMAENRLLAVPVRWRNPIKRPSSAVRVGKEADERRAEKMPSAAALDALPRIFRFASEPVDVITASVAAILLASPDRISEVLTLPEACEVREPRKGKEDAYGLRWWPAKGAKPMVKWLVPSMASVVEEALQKIRAVTERLGVSPSGMS